MNKEQLLKKQIGQGILDYLLNVGYDADKILPFVKKVLSADINYSNEDEALALVTKKIKSMKNEL